MGDKDHLQLQIRNDKIRKSLFHYLIRHIRGENNVKKLYEILLTKKQVYDEYIEHFRTYVNQQSYLFNAFLNNNLSESDVIIQFHNFGVFTNDTILEFNRMFNRRVQSTCEI